MSKIKKNNSHFTDEARRKKAIEILESWIQNLKPLDENNNKQETDKP